MALLNTAQNVVTSAEVRILRCVQVLRGVCKSCDGERGDRGDGEYLPAWSGYTDLEAWELKKAAVELGLARSLEPDRWVEVITRSRNRFIREHPTSRGSYQPRQCAKYELMLIDVSFS